MIYDDMTFVATPDPCHPGRFRIVVYPPIGYELRMNPTGYALKPEDDKEKIPAARRPDYIPTTTQIEAAAQAIRATNDKAILTGRYEPVDGKPGKVYREEGGRKPAEREKREYRVHGMARAVVSRPGGGVSGVGDAGWRGGGDEP